MKYCSCCNKEYPESNDVCPNCGNPMYHTDHHVCPECHRELPSNDLENCPYCYAELGGEGAKRARARKKQGVLEVSQKRHEDFLRNQLVETPKRPNWVRRTAHLVVLALAFFLLVVTLLPILSFTNGTDTYLMSMFSAFLNEVKVIISVISQKESFKLESYYLLDLILACLALWNAVKFLILFFNLLSQANHKDEFDCKKDAKRNIFHAILGIIHGGLVYAFALIGPKMILKSEELSNVNMNGALYYLLIVEIISVLLLILSIVSTKTITVKVKQGQVKAYHAKKHFGQGLLAFIFALIIMAGAAGAGYLLYTETNKNTTSPTIVETKTEAE